jgi:hypothetical protein
MRLEHGLAFDGRMLRNAALRRCGRLYSEAFCLILDLPGILRLGRKCTPTCDEQPSMVSRCGVGGKRRRGVNAVPSAGWRQHLESEAEGNDTEDVVSREKGGQAAWTAVI